ncbi:MAG: hypothetical protein HFJ59_05415 [Clostridia bacterium]|nr:hypothetical protein [Clostridia bacterium]
MDNKIILNGIYKKVIILFAFLFLAYFVFTVINIKYYLKEYGYSIKELPKTIAVYFHLSKGFTVEQNENDKSIFIGRHNYIYDNVFKKNGYYNSERLGNSVIYIKNENGKQIRLYVLSTDDWCHWFRIYKIEGAKIEDFI